jgi:predicted SnoaL-like aldol condensation-catalyzing enzyme
MHTDWFMRMVGVGGALTALAGCATMAAYEQELTKTNTQTVLAFEETVFNKHEPQLAFDHYVGPTFRQHDPHLNEDRDAVLRAYTALTRTYPGASMQVERTIAQGDLVAVQATWLSSTDQRPVAVVDIYRLIAGRIIEHWAVVAGRVSEQGPSPL